MEMEKLFGTPVKHFEFPANGPPWPETPSACPVQVCPRRLYKTYTEFCVHWNKMHRDRIYYRECEICKKKFYTLEAARDHREKELHGKRLTVLKLISVRNDLFVDPKEVLPFQIISGKTEKLSQMPKHQSNMVSPESLDDADHRDTDTVSEQIVTSNTMVQESFQQEIDHTAPKHHTIAEPEVWFGEQYPIPTEAPKQGNLSTSIIVSNAWFNPAVNNGVLGNRECLNVFQTPYMPCVVQNQYQSVFTQSLHYPLYQLWSAQLKQRQLPVVPVQNICVSSSYLQVPVSEALASPSNALPSQPNSMNFNPAPNTLAPPQKVFDQPSNNPPNYPISDILSNVPNKQTVLPTILNSSDRCPFWPQKATLCPVPTCPRKYYDSFQEFQDHWALTHCPKIFLFECLVCLKQCYFLGEIREHWKKHEGVDVPKSTEVNYRIISIYNNRYIDPKNALPFVINTKPAPKVDPVKYLPCKTSQAKRVKKGVNRNANIDVLSRSDLTNLCCKSGDKKEIIKEKTVTAAANAVKPASKISSDMIKKEKVDKSMLKTAAEQIKSSLHVIRSESKIESPRRETSPCSAVGVKRLNVIYSPSFEKQNMTNKEKGYSKQYVSNTKQNETEVNRSSKRNFDDKVFADVYCSSNIIKASETIKRPSATHKNKIGNTNESKRNETASSENEVKKVNETRSSDSLKAQEIDLTISESKKTKKEVCLKRNKSEMTASNDTVICKTKIKDVSVIETGMKTSNKISEMPNDSFKIQQPKTGNINEKCNTATNSRNNYHSDIEEKVRNTTKSIRNNLEESIADSFSSERKIRQVDSFKMNSNDDSTLKIEDDTSEIKIQSSINVGEDLSAKVVSNIERSETVSKLQNANEDSTTQSKDAVSKKEENWLEGNDNICSPGLYSGMSEKVAYNSDKEIVSYQPFWPGVPTCCPVAGCSKVGKFKRLNNFSLHWNKIHVEFSLFFKCDYCNTKFESERKAEAHKKLCSHRDKDFTLTAVKIPNKNYIDPKGMLPYQSNSDEKKAPKSKPGMSPNSMEDSSAVQKSAEKVKLIDVKDSSDIQKSSFTFVSADDNDNCDENNGGKEEPAVADDLFIVIKQEESVCSNTMEKEVADRLSVVDKEGISNYVEDECVDRKRVEAAVEPRENKISSCELQHAVKSIPDDQASVSLQEKTCILSSTKEIEPNELWTTKVLYGQDSAEKVKSSEQTKGDKKEVCSPTESIETKSKISSDDLTFHQRSEMDNESSEKETDETHSFPSWPNKPSPCPVPSCTKFGNFPSFSVFETHWWLFHKLRELGKPMEKYIDPENILPYKERLQASPAENPNTLPHCKVNDNIEIKAAQTKSSNQEKYVPRKRRYGTDLKALGHTDAKLAKMKATSTEQKNSLEPEMGPKTAFLYREAKINEETKDKTKTDNKKLDIWPNKPSPCPVPACAKLGNFPSFSVFKTHWWLFHEPDRIFFFCKICNKKFAKALNHDHPDLDWKKECLIKEPNNNYIDPTSYCPYKFVEKMKDKAVSSALPPGSEKVNVGNGNSKTISGDNDTDRVTWTNASCISLGLISEEPDFPLWPGMPTMCTVPACAKYGKFKTYLSFKSHWKDVHYYEKTFYSCKACGRRMTSLNLDEHTHGGKYKLKDICVSRKELNKYYIDPVNSRPYTDNKLQLKMMKTDESTSVAYKSPDAEGIESSSSRNTTTKVSENIISQEIATAGMVNANLQNNSLESGNSSEIERPDSKSNTMLSTDKGIKSSVVCTSTRNKDAESKSPDDEGIENNSNIIKISEKKINQDTECVSVYPKRPKSVKIESVENEEKSAIKGTDTVAGCATSSEANVNLQDNSLESQNAPKIERPDSEPNTVPSTNQGVKTLVSTSARNEETESISNEMDNSSGLKPVGTSSISDSEWPVWPGVPTACPVQACASRGTMGNFDVFYKHWRKFHYPDRQFFMCKVCKGRLNNSDIKKHDHGENLKIKELRVRETEPNPLYIDPGNCKCFRRRKRETRTTNIDDTVNKNKYESENIPSDPKKFKTKESVTCRNDQKTSKTLTLSHKTRLCVSAGSELKLNEGPLWPGVPAPCLVTSCFQNSCFFSSLTKFIEHWHTYHVKKIVHCVCKICGLKLDRIAALKHEFKGALTDENWIKRISFNPHYIDPKDVWPYQGTDKEIHLHTHMFETSDTTDSAMTEESENISGSANSITFDTDVEIPDSDFFLDTDSSETSLDPASETVSNQISECSKMTENDTEQNGFSFDTIDNQAEAAGTKSIASSGQMLNDAIWIELESSIDPTTKKADPKLIWTKWPERPTCCPVTICKGRTMFRKYKDFKEHWYKMHRKIIMVYQCECEYVASNRQNIEVHRNIMHPYLGKFFTIKIFKTKNLAYIDPGNILPYLHGSDYEQKQVQTDWEISQFEDETNVEIEHKEDTTKAASETDATDQAKEQSVGSKQSPKLVNIPTVKLTNLTDARIFTFVEPFDGCCDRNGDQPEKENGPFKIETVIGISFTKNEKYEEVKATDSDILNSNTAGSASQEDTSRPLWPLEPTECPVPACLKEGSFSTFVKFMAHWNNIHNERKCYYQCVPCGTIFSDVGDMTSHRNTKAHEGEAFMTNRIIVPNPEFIDSGAILPYQYGTAEERGKMIKEKEKMDRAADLLASIRAKLDAIKSKTSKIS